jgi:cyclic pyranopterin phosphate synthase
MSDNFTHLTEEGNARMVDVGNKAVTQRKAKAICKVQVSDEVIKLINEKNLPKGDLFSTVRIAGIMASKKVAELIPLCHPINIDAVDVQIEVINNEVIITSEVKIEAKTGVEMEALTAVSVAGLTVIDMVKGIDPSASIVEVKVLEKSGGKNDRWVNPK